MKGQILAVSTVLFGNQRNTDIGFAAQQTFAAGSTPKVVVVGDFNGDGKPDITVSDWDGSSVSVLLNATAATIAATSVAIAATAASKAEGQSGSTPFTFTVTRGGLTTGATSVNWAVTGSGASPANVADLAGGVLPSGVLSFAAGATSQTVTVNVAGDTAVEANEGFTVTLSKPSAGAIITTASAAGTILNDDTAGQIYVLTPVPVTIAAGIGNDLFIAKGSTLNSHDRIDGGGGYNQLQLSGSGSFDLAAPALFSNMQLILASEGQAAGGGTANGTQMIYLRDGLNVTLNVASGTPNPADPNPETVTIYGTADNSIINLGGGRDSVVLGSAGETVHGGTGAALVQATVATAGALVSGGSGKGTPEITDGGAATLTDATTSVTVKLDAATHLTLSKMGFPQWAAAAPTRSLRWRPVRP